MEGILPLYYDMRKAKSDILNNKNIYDGLSKAFTGGNIGIYSNNISKIWNDDIFINGTDEQKQSAIDNVKRLCCQNNMVIDFAKTLYKTEFPKHIKQDIKYFTDKKLPHFFKYAKDKDNKQVRSINGSIVNRLNSIIPNPRIEISKIGLKPIDYKNLMCNKDLEINIRKDLHKFEYEELNIQEKIVKKYIELNKNFGYKIMNINNDTDRFKNVLRVTYNDSMTREILLYGELELFIKEQFRQFIDDDILICDILIKYLFTQRNTRYKALIWFCYGEQIYNNLQSNFTLKTKVIQCEDCGEWFEVNKNNYTTYKCKSCYDDERRKYLAEAKRKSRLRLQK